MGVKYLVFPSLPIVYDLCTNNMFDGSLPIQTILFDILKNQLTRQEQQNKTSNNKKGNCQPTLHAVLKFMINRMTSIV
jgi:hypothetical protein